MNKNWYFSVVFLKSSLSFCSFTSLLFSLFVHALNICAFLDLVSAEINFQI